MKTQKKNITLFPAQGFCKSRELYVALFYWVNRKREVARCDFAKNYGNDDYYKASINGVKSPGLITNGHHVSCYLQAFCAKQMLRQQPAALNVLSSKTGRVFPSAQKQRKKNKLHTRKLLIQHIFHRCKSQKSQDWQHGFDLFVMMIPAAAFRYCITGAWPASGALERSTFIIQRKKKLLNTHKKNQIHLI